MSATRGLRNTFVVPRWLANRPGKNVGYKLIYACLMLLDIFIEWAVESVRAGWPGEGTPTALPLIGRSRGILRGPSEDDDTFIARLIAWLDTWKQAGSSVGLADQIRSYLIGQGSLGAGIQPCVRIVDRSGNWTIAHSDGSVEFASGAWNWDEVLGWDDGVARRPAATVDGYWSDIWVIIACEQSPPRPVYPVYASTSDPAWVANFGTNAALGGGCQIPLEVTDGILQIVANWKGAHTWVRAIILPADLTSFTPATPTADGTFGNWSKLSGTAQVPARTAGARFIIPAGGG